MGLDINNVRSKVTVPLDFEITLKVSRIYALWVEYYGDRKNIDVYMEKPSKDSLTVEKPVKPILTSGLDLK